MRPVAEWDESDLLTFILEEVKESLTLDYKRSAALGKGNKEKNDVCKDVSAFANSAGGILIYGIVENGHAPTVIDRGVDRNQITKEWLESIRPSVEGLLIRQIGLSREGPDMVAYALEIQQATSRAPHQANDHRYYKRFNFESTPMEDYEVRDLMRRSIEYGRKYGAAWNLDVELRRLVAAIDERRLVSSNSYIPRDRLIIGVSDALRTSGDAMTLLPKPVRKDVASLVTAVDVFNANIEMVDPGRRDEARLNETRKEELGEMAEWGRRISGALEVTLENEP